MGEIHRYYKESTTSTITIAVPQAKEFYCKLGYNRSALGDHRMDVSAGGALGDQQINGRAGGALVNQHMDATVVLVS